jgi:ABC-2 type transport system permease protein
VIGRVWAAYQFEFSKTARRRATYAGPVAVVLMVLIVWYQYTGGRADADGLRFIAVATPIALNLLGLLLVVVFSSGLIAGEVGSGSIRLALTRPIRRSELLAGKILLAMTYAAALTAIAGMTAWGVAMAAHGIQGVEYGGDVWYTGTEMFYTYLVCALLGLFPLFAACAYGAMWSAVFSNGGAAVGAAVVVWIMVDAIKEPLGISPLLFTSYVETSWAVFSDRCDLLEPTWFPNAYRSIAASVSAFVIFSGIAHIALDRRNVVG